MLTAFSYDSYLVSNCQALDICVGLISQRLIRAKAISVYPYFFDRDSFEDKASAESMRRRLAELKRGLSGLDGVYYKTLLQKDPLGLFDTAKVSLERLLPKPRGAVLRNGRICTPDCF